MYFLVFLGLNIYLFGEGLLTTESATLLIAGFCVLRALLGRMSANSKYENSVAPFFSEYSQVYGETELGQKFLERLNATPGTVNVPIGARVDAHAGDYGGAMEGVAVAGAIMAAKGAFNWVAGKWDDADKPEHQLELEAAVRAGLEEVQAARGAMSGSIALAVLVYLSLLIFLNL